MKNIKIILVSMLCIIGANALAVLNPAEKQRARTLKIRINKFNQTINQRPKNNNIFIDAKEKTYFESMVKELNMLSKKDSSLIKDATNATNLLKTIQKNTQQAKTTQPKITQQKKPKKNPVEKNNTEKVQGGKLKPTKTVSKNMFLTADGKTLPLLDIIRGFKGYIFLSIRDNMAAINVDTFLSSLTPEIIERYPEIQNTISLDQLKQEIEAAIKSVPHTITMELPQSAQRAIEQYYQNIQKNIINPIKAKYKLQVQGAGRKPTTTTSKNMFLTADGKTLPLLDIIRGFKGYIFLSIRDNMAAINVDTFLSSLTPEIIERYPEIQNTISLDQLKQEIEAAIKSVPHTITMELPQSAQRAIEQYYQNIQKNIINPIKAKYNLQVQGAGRKPTTTTSKNMFLTADGKTLPLLDIIRGFKGYIFLSVRDNMAAINVDTFLSSLTPEIIERYPEIQNTISLDQLKQEIEAAIKSVPHTITMELPQSAQRAIEQYYQNIQKNIINPIKAKYNLQ